MENRLITEVEEEEAKQLIWSTSESEPKSMVSMTVGRVITTLLGARSKKLHHSVSNFSLDSTNRPSLGSLEDCLSFLFKYVKEVSERGEKLDEVLVPIIQHSLKSKDSKSCGPGLLVINWLFQYELIFRFVAEELADIISRKEDRYVAFGWCILVRSLVEYERFMAQFTLHGIRDNYSAFLKILCKRIPHLSCIVCKGSSLQNGFELPSRLSVAAADCILAVSEALTKQRRVASSGPKSLISTSSDWSRCRVSSNTEDKKVKLTTGTSEVSMSEMPCLLWKRIDDLITVVQRLLAWSKKSRPLHAKGVEQVLKWLQDLKRHYSYFHGEVTKYANIIETRRLLLSSCWKHYSMLLHLEDSTFHEHCSGLLDEYIHGIQYYTKSHSEGHAEEDSGIETSKFFLNCLCLLLGRLDGKKFERMVFDYGAQLSQVLISQLHVADEDVISGAVCIFKAAIIRPKFSSANSGRQMDTLLPNLLPLLDERDGTARAVVMLLAEYCSLSTDNHCLEQVLSRLTSGSSQQRLNSIDVISELVLISSDSGNKISSLAWQDIAKILVECLSDDDSVIRERASSLLQVIDPSMFLPTLVHLVYSSDERIQSSASAVLLATLQNNNQNPEVICMLLDSLSNLNQSLDISNSGQDTRQAGIKDDSDRILKLISEWSKSVEDWKSFIGPVIEKMFSEPANATIVRFLSCVSEHIADAGDVVLRRVLSHMQEQKEIEEGLLSRRENRSYTTKDTDIVQKDLFQRLCPLLIVRLLPLRVFNDLKSAIMYGQLPNRLIVTECGDIVTNDEACIATFLLKRSISKSEFDDVRKLAAELCGRLHPQVLFSVVLPLLEHAAASRDIQKIKSCLFSVCTSLLIRGKEAIAHPTIVEMRKTLKTILLWPSLDGDEVSKAQHGCIDCLALMVCVELQDLGSYKGYLQKLTAGNSDSGNAKSGNYVLSYVIDQLLYDGDDVASESLVKSESCVLGVTVPISFRLCMANVLISACQKISDPGKKPLAKRTIPCLIQSIEVIAESEVRAACVQVMFSAVYHLKAAVLPYSSDLLKVSLKFLRKGTDKERMAGAKLMAALMASEDKILARISEGLIEARSVLSNVSLSDPSPDIRLICKQLLDCFSFP
ncbi:hypothetical protein K2173_005253 [Erythroxylum novogranatense]|uniref:ARM repeat superfamily protein n=1 Tax=Erythroxylum novogranatense TaxID=1862640 RepID=A0AAV8TUN8_9ROSI|nr:hypothetical protein K2173_005253 [Erythroxylum novogranatense]